MNKTKDLKEKLNKFGSDKEPFLFVLSYDLEKLYIEKLSKLPKNIKYKINENPNNKIDFKTTLEKEPIHFKEYKSKFDILQEEIKKGNTYLANLTTKTKIYTEFSLNDIFDKVDSKFKLLFENNNDKFVCFSPEKFVQINENKILTYPMKGTIDSSIKNAKTLILGDIKEMAEHTMVVDLLRNDLSINASHVRVDDFRFVDTINAGDKKLLQVSSKISGNLSENWNEKLGDILTSMLPAGSITGTPKKKTIEIINDIEGYDRGYYTGICGIYDGKKLDSYVLIRFIEEDKKGNKFYKSGGGITCDSDANKEYQEMLDKVYLPF